MTLISTRQRFALTAAFRPTQQWARTAARLLALPLPRMSIRLDLRSRWSSMAIAQADWAETPPFTERRPRDLTTVWHYSDV
jgi:hypothetical protein